MKKKRLDAFGLGIAALVISSLAASVYSLAKWAKSINEPNPSTISAEKLAILERRINFESASVKFDKLIYINLDYMAHIFEGEVKCNRGEFEWKPDRDLGHVITNEQFEKLFPGRYGVLCVRRISGGPDVWGFVVATTHGEWRQGEPMFRAKWKELVKQR